MFRRKVHSLERVFFGGLFGISFEKISAEADGGRWWATGSGQISRTKSIRTCRCERRFHTGNAFLGQNWGANMHIAATTEHFKCVTESSQSAFCSREVAVALVCSRSVHERVNFRPSSFRIYSGITLIVTSLTITSL